MELKQIQDLIKFVAKSGVEEVEMEKGNFKITIRTKTKNESEGTQQIIYTQPAGMVQPPVMQAPSPAPAAAPATEASTPAPSADKGSNENSGLHIKAPMIGTFYRSSGPDKEPFVKVGDRVEAGQVVCIIEAMKLFNEIESEVSGTITKVLVDDTNPVEYDQPLFVVEP